jgi:hypothetical protein
MSLAATLANWWLAEHQGVARWTVPLVMLIAAAKARAVALHFMELKAALKAGHAPLLSLCSGPKETATP